MSVFRRMAAAILVAVAVASATALVAPAAEAGFSKAMSAYDRGDYHGAFREFRPLAEAGDADAQFWLGYLYQTGKGTLQDYVEAHAWFNLAAAQAREGAAKARDRVSKAMTAAQIAEAQALARDRLRSQRTASASQPGAQTSATSSGATSSEPTRLTGRSLVRAIQDNLAAMGYTPGPADGLMGGRTRNAIRTFQAERGLTVNGQPSGPLLDEIKRARAGGHRAGRATASASGGAASAPDPRTQAFVERFGALIDEGERNRAADPRFLEDLRAAIARYSARTTPQATSQATAATQTTEPPRDTGPRVLLDDAFQDGNYTRNPQWEVLSGTFFVDQQFGLRSRVDPSQGSRGGGGGGDVIGSILDEVLGSPKSGSGSAKEARIYTAVATPNAFSLDVELVPIGGAARNGFEFTVIKGRRNVSGYSFVYLTGANPPEVEIVRFGGRQSVLVRRVRGAPVLSNGRTHRLEWRRGADGEMIISLDGRELIRARDTAHQGGFDGVGVTNFGGEVGIKRVRVYEGG